MRLLVLVFLALGLTATNAAAKMKPEYKDNARCRGVLDIAHEAFTPAPQAGETQAQADARAAQEQSPMAGFAVNVGKARDWFTQTMIQDEALNVTSSESAELQKIEDAEADRFATMINAAKTEKESDAALDQLFTAIEPCLDKTGLFK